MMNRRVLRRRPALGLYVCEDYDVAAFAKSDRRHAKRPLALCLILAGIPLLAATGSRADRLLLRDLELIRGPTVSDFDEDGVRISGRVIPWDQIQRGTVSADKQAEFDRMLNDLGEPLFRIRLRLRIGDFQSLGVYAESIYPRFAERDSETAYMVSHALMRSRITDGRREEAVEPYLRCLAYRLNSNGNAQSPGEQPLEFDPATGLTQLLVPAWFDEEAAKRVLPQVRNAVRAVKHPRPDGVYLYYASLALAAGDHETAQDTIELVAGKNASASQLRDVLLAQQEIASGQVGDAVARMEASLVTWLPHNQALALYWLGRQKTMADDDQQRQLGVLSLLRLPALFGDDFPELAGAGLYQAAKTLDELHDKHASGVVRRELLLRYAHTIHGARVKGVDPSAAPDFN